MDDFKPIGQNVYDDDERPSGLIGQSGSMASFLRDYEVEETPTTTVIEKNSFAAPRADQVEYLKAYPDTASDFDGRFGPGAAAKALGTPKVVEDADKMQVVQSPITGLDVLARVGADDGVPAILDGYLTSQRLAEETTEDVARTNSLKAVWDQGASDKAASWIDGEVESAAKSVAALEADAKRGPITLDAQNRLDTARARLKAAQDVKADAAAGERQMTPKERVMMAMLIEAQSGVIDKAVRELQQFDSDPEYRKDLMARSASAGLDEARWNKDVREILAKRVNEAVRRRDLLRQALSQGRMRGAMTDATAIGEFVRSYARGIAQATGIMGGALNQWAESLEGEAGLGDALKSWSNKIIEDIPAEAAPELLKIQSARDVSLWFSSKLGQAFGTTLPIVASAIAAGPTAGVTAGLAMGQGEMRNTLEDALLAEGVEISKSEMQRIVMTYGTIIGGLDAIVPVLISRSGLRMILTTSAKRAAQVGIARQLAVAVARDSTIEGATEAAQEFLLEWGTADALDRGIDFEAFAPKAIEAFAAGFAGGVGFTTVGIPGEYSQIMRRRRDEALEAAEKIRTEIEAQTPAKPDAGDAGGGMAVPTEAPGTNEVVTSRPPSDPTAEAPKIPDRPKIIAKPRTPIPESKPVERPKAPDRPQTAIEYIRERGGIIDEGGDLAAMDAPRGVIADNGQGLSPDAMRESLVQAGYLPTPAEGEQEFTTADDVYDIVQRSLAGERVVAIGREADEATYQDYRKSGNLDEQSNEILNDLRDSLGEYGIAYDLTEIEEQRVVDLVRNEGLTPDDAFERNAIMRGSGAAEVRANEPGQADVPFPPMSGGRGVSQPGAVDIASRLPQLRAYLKGGGSLSRKAYRQIAQSTGVPQSQVREFLEAAEDAGIVKRDRRGAFRRDQVDDPNVVEIDVFDDLPSEDKEQPKSVSIDDFISDVERLKEKFGAPEKETIEAQDIEPINVDVKFAIGGGLTVKVTDAGPLLERIADDLRSFQSESNETLAVLERMQDVEIEGSSAEDLARLRTALVDLQKIVQDRLQASYALSDQIYTFENDLQTRFQDAVNRIESVEDRADTLTSEIVDLFDRIEGELESRGVDLNDESREKYDGSGQQLIAPYVDEDVDQSKTLIELFEEKAKSLEKSGASFDKIERLLSSEPDLEAMSIDELESMLDTLNEAQGALLTRLDVSRFYLKYYNEEGFDKIGERFDEIRKDIIEPATERLEDGADEIESFIADVDELASGSPQLASAAQTQNTMTRMVQSQLRSGKTVRISDRTIDRVRNALAPMLHHIPSDAQVAVIQTIKPSPLVKKTDRVDLEMLDLRTGESFSLVDVPFTVREIANVRAFHVPSGSVSSGNGAIVFAPLTLAGVPDHSLRGQAYHETVHFLRAQGLLDGVVWDRLVAHAYNLRVMGMQLGTVLKIVNDPTAGNAGDSTLIDAYTDRYEPRFDTIEKLNDALAEEGVAHFVELAYHGHWIDAEIAPVADELNAILSGAYGDQTTVAPDASSVMAAINSFDRQSVTPGLPMDKASRMARAKEMGFDTDEIYYHGTGTSRQIDEFGLKNRRGEMLPTFFVGEGNKRFANGFSTIEDGRIYPVHLNQSKFLDTKKASHRKALDDLIASNGLMPEEVYKKNVAGERILPGWGNTRVFDMVRDAGWTGMRIQERPDFESVAVFDPRNIRSVNAAFDPARADSPNLMFAIGALAQENNATPVDWLSGDAHPDGPILAFHGTPVDFKQFDLAKSRDIGIHFGTVDQANDRLEITSVEAPQRVIPVVLDIKNPITLPDLGSWSILGLTKALRRQIKTVPENVWERLRDLDDLSVQDDAIGEDARQRGYALLRDVLDEAGYDGIRYKNLHESFPDDYDEMTSEFEPADVAQWSYIVWSKGKVRSATDKNGVMFALRAEGMPVARANAPTPPLPRAIDELGYYSAALEAAKSWKQDKGTPEQVLAHLKKSGVKDAEIEATGLGPLLDGQKSITKSDLIRHLNDKRVRVMEGRYDEVSEWLVTDSAGRVQGTFVSRGDAQRWINQNSTGERGFRIDQMRAADREPKWSEYSVDPKNPTYRETVIHLPSKVRPGDELTDARSRELLDDDILADPDGVDFRGGHFSEPNIIAHARTSIHKGPDGKKTFLIGELQSDWGQKLRDGGVRDEAKIAELKKRYSEADAAWSAKDREVREFLKANNVSSEFVAEKRGIPRASDMIAERQRLEDERSRLQAEYFTAQATVVGNPLVNKTDQWVTTAMRRMVRQAVDDGAEYIAIPSGKTVDDYGMGAPIDGLEYAYGKMYPSKMKDVLRRLDKAAAHPVEVATLKSHDGRDVGRGFTVFPITDKVRTKIADGQPLFALAGQTSPGGRTRQPTPANQSPLEDRPNRSLTDLVEDLTTALSLPNQPTPVRQGRLNPGLKALAGRLGLTLRGQHSQTSGVIRLRTKNDIETLAHEGGHALEARFRDDFRSMMELHRDELEQIATPGRDALSEGFAEFFRLYITNPRVAENRAPDFFEDFEDYIDRNEPDLVTAFQDVQDGYDDLIRAPSGGVVLSSIQTSRRGRFVEDAMRAVRNKGFTTAVSDWFNGTYAAGIDNLNPVNQAVAQLLETARANLDIQLPANQSIGLTAAQDPYKLFRLARNGYQAGHIDLMRGVIPYQGMAPEGPSLREVIVQAVGGEGNADWSDDNLLAFGGYLVSRRMVREYARFDAGEIDRVPDKYSLGDHEQAIRDLEAAYPSFRNAATLVYDYQRNILRKLYEGGILTDEQYQDYVNRDDYVPVNRVMDDDGVGGAVDGAGKFSPIKRFRGSTRDIINPLESIAKFSYEVNYMIRRNDGVRAIEALARAAGPGGGAIAERIPASEMRGTRIDVIDAVRQAGRQQGVDDADMVFMLQSIEDTLGEDADAILFRPGEINEGGEPIVYLWEGGKRVPIRLADGNFGRELYRAITQITPVVQAEVLIKAFTAPSQFLRAGITLDPAFLAANYFRDQLSAWMLTEDFTPFTDGARGTYDAVRSSYGAEVADLDMFNALGGIMGGEGVEGLNEARWNKDVRELRRKGVRMAPWRWNPLGRDFWTWTGWTETGTRLQMFRNARQRALRDGMNEHEAMMEAAFTSNDYIDFGRYGSRMMTTKRMVLFLNAALQGLDKARRVAMGQSENTRTVGEIVSPYIRHTDGQPLTVQERKRLGVAAKFWAKIAVYSALGFALFLLYQDDDEFEEIDEYHRVHSHLFKINGQWVRLPRPFELGAFGYAMEKAYEAHYKGDETAYNHMREGIASLVTPPHSIPGIQVAFEVATNTKLPFGDGIFSAMFKSMKGETVGRPIVPLHLQDETPEEQYTAYTSEFVKWLAQQTGVSAAKLEHIITGLGGGLGRAFLGTTDMIATETGLAERVSDAQDAVFVKRFTLDPVRSARAKREFWDQMSRTSDGLMRSAMNYKQDMQFGRTEAAQAKLARMTEQQRAFAILHAHGDINERRRHPMQRAYDVIGVLNAVRRDLGQGLPDSEGNPYTLDDRRVVKVIIEQLQMREARNALVLIGQPGYRQRSILTTDAIWKELQTKVPDLYEEIEHRLDSKKVQDFDDVRADWPDLRRDLLSGDYAADNPVDQKSLRKSN